MARIEPEIIGTSAAAIAQRMKNVRVWRMTKGKCWYCGGPVVHRGQPAGRNWLFVRPVRHRMVREHVLPTSRGGKDELSNYVPACFECNYVKGSFTADEFRFVRGLQSGSLNYRFAFEPPSAVQRDWLLCHSAPFERSLIVHNRPSAAGAYELRRRNPGGPLQTPRIRMVHQ